MKHILVIITSFRHGGISKSLQNITSLIDNDKYNIDIFALEHYGPYQTMLSNCNILKSNIFVESLIANWRDTKGIAKLRTGIMKVTCKIVALIKIDLQNIVFKLAAKNLIKKDYDRVIAFSEGVPTVFASFLPFSNKIAWIHCDYSSYMKLNKYPDELKIYKIYKSIVCVSQYTNDEFCKYYPELSKKTYALKNIIDTAYVLNKANDLIIDSCYSNNQFNIISIGGINVVKRFSKIPEIVRALLDKGCVFRWYLIGSTMQIQEQNVLENNMKKYDVEDYFICLGAKDNPYPYISQADLLVNTSISEAAPHVINEALILHVPVVCTDFGSAKEFIDNGVNGLIVPIEEIVKKVEQLIKDKSEYNKLKKGVSKFTYRNDLILKQLYMLLES
ncbi:MAG: glycosyltransferase [Chlorobium sp.]|nr:MAG: glycosyltransferase [Chlorobium sp.]